MTVTLFGGIVVPPCPYCTIKLARTLVEGEWKCACCGYCFRWLAERKTISTSTRSP